MTLVTTDVKTLSNDGKLLKRWELPGVSARVAVVGVKMADGRHYTDIPVHLDPKTFHIYTRVPHEADGKLLIAPATQEGQDALLARVGEEAHIHYLSQRAQEDDDRPWSRVIRVVYNAAHVAQPSWGGGREVTGHSHRSRAWELPPWYEPRSASMERTVNVQEARALGVTPTARARYWGHVSVPKENLLGTGSDVIGPLVVSRFEVWTEEHWDDAHDPNGSMVGLRDNRNPLMHTREWREDYEARLATWEREASRSKADQESKPTRHRTTHNTPLRGRLLPWSEDRWAHLLDFQERIRGVDRTLRQFLEKTEDELFLATLSRGRLLMAPGTEDED